MRHLSRFIFAALLLAPSALALGGCPREIDHLPDAVAPDFDAGRPDAAIDAGPNIERCESPGSTLGDACVTNEDCTDFCFCNGLEECRDGRCQAGNVPCREDLVDCTTITCAESEDRCVTTLDHEMCSDGDACNGTEQCNPVRGCQGGPPPVCNDESSCTIDSCDPATGCVYTPRDLDGDGYISSSCGGDDCDDDPRYGGLIHPGAVEICDNRRDDDCDGARDYNDSDCVPTNDTCDVATVLELGATGGTFSGATTGLRRNYTLRCGGSGPDAVFRFHLDEARDVRIAATASGATIALRAFAQCASGPEEKCNTGSPPSILRRSLPAGDYAVIVSTISAQPFDLSVRLSDPTATPATDVCGAGTTVVPPTGGTFTGDFSELEDDYGLSCNSSGGRDAVYAIDVPSGSLKDLRVSVSLSTSSYVYVYAALTTDCDARSSELTCGGGYLSTTLSRRELRPGRYYVILEPNSADAGPYTATFTLTDSPPRVPGDICSTPLDLTPAASPGSRTQTISVATLDPMLDARPSCGPTSGRDAVFQFTLTATQDVTLNATGPGTLYGALLGATCGPGSTERGCWTGSSGGLVRSIRSLPAGTYYYVVETTGASGTLSMTLETRAPTALPMNDLCTSATTMTSGSTYRDTLVGFANEMNVAACSGGAVNLPDAFYRFTLTERRSVLIDITRDSGGPVYAALIAGCGSASSPTCGTSSGTTNTIRATLDPGTYYVIVEMPPSSTSEFVLQYVTLAP